MVMIGGARLLLGPLAGGILVAFLPELLNLDPVQSRIVYGVCLIAVILLLPERRDRRPRSSLWRRLVPQRDPAERPQRTRRAPEREARR